MNGDKGARGEGTQKPQYAAMKLQMQGRKPCWVANSSRSVNASEWLIRGAQKKEKSVVVVLIMRSETASVFHHCTGHARADRGRN